MVEDKRLKLGSLKAEMIKQDVASELAASATQLVFGDGNEDAELVFIGEAPGKKEDELGKPFVGTAGKFLDEMLGLIGLSRQDIYTTNIVKYRPPNNRDPLPTEKLEFLPYLQRQLEIIRPKILVTLGRHSLNCFLPDLQISKVHGQAQKAVLSLKDQSSMPVVVLPLYHPAAALYNGSLRQTLINDFLSIPAIIKQVKA